MESLRLVRPVARAISGLLGTRTYSTMAASKLGLGRDGLPRCSLKELRVRTLEATNEEIERLPKRCRWWQL
jgi:hypothetical protein